MKNPKFKRLILSMALTITVGVFLFSGTAFADADITGTVKYDNGVGIYGVEVSVDFSHRSTTNSYGQYRIRSVPEGWYTVKAEKYGYKFSAGWRSTSVTIRKFDTSVSGPDFTSPTFYISGYVTYNNKAKTPIRYALVSCSYPGGSDSTDSYGYYKIDGLIHGSYLVSYGSDQQYVSIPGRSLSGSVEGVDFEVKKVYYDTEVYGYVKKKDGTPIRDVDIVARVDSKSHTPVIKKIASTDKNGWYSYSAFNNDFVGRLDDPEACTIYLIAEKTDYVFDPYFAVSFKHDPEKWDRRGHEFNFTGTPLYNISGMLKYDDGKPIEGVTVYICSPDIACPTDKNGLFTSDLWMVVDYDIHIHWDSLWNPDVEEIYGWMKRITDTDKDGKPLENWWVAVPAEYEWEAPKPEGLEEGEYEWDSRLFQFEGVEGSFNILKIFTIGRDITNLVFTATKYPITETYSIEGCVKDYSKNPKGEGMEGVTITYTGQKDPLQTDGNGNYKIDNLYNGTYTIKAEKAGYVFDSSPHNGIVIIEETNRININFHNYSISGRVTRYGSGEGVDGLTVTSYDIVRGETTSARTHSGGYYQTGSLPGGTYDVRVGDAGYYYRPSYPRIGLKPDDDYYRIILDPNLQDNLNTINFEAIMPPTADFAADKTSGVAPLEVKFTSSGYCTGDVGFLQWNFGDPASANNTSSQPNLTHTFSNPGSYEVTLTVKAPYGLGTDSIAKKTIQVNTPPKPPVAVIKADKDIVNEGGLVILDGSGSSDPNNVGINWKDSIWSTTLGTVEVSPQEVHLATFTAPKNITTPGPLTAEISLVVVDNLGVESVNTNNKVVITINRPPANVNAGEDQIVNEGTKVTLTGSATDPDGDTLYYTWKQIEGQDVVLTPADSTAKNVTFTAPTGIAGEAKLKFQITLVRDRASVGSGMFVINSTATVEVKINRKPANVNAGADQIVNEGATVTLTGSATDLDGDKLYYVWEQIKGQGVTLEPTDNTAQKVTFTAPTSIAGDATLQFKITSVRDRENVRDIGFIVPSTATVEVKINRKPANVNAGADQIVNEGATVTLTGSATDPDDDTLYYKWEKIEGPDVVLESADDTTPQATFTAPGAAATMKFRLKVRDRQSEQAGFIVPLADSDANTVEIRINRPPANVIAEAQPALIHVKKLDSYRGEVTLTVSEPLTDPDGDTLYYKWEQIDSTPVVGTLVHTDETNPQATYKIGDKLPHYVILNTRGSEGGIKVRFRLTVRDHEDEQAALTAQSPPIEVTINRAPFAVLTVKGNKIVVNGGEAIELDSSSSVDLDGKGSISYSFTQAGPEWTLIEGGGLNDNYAKFKAPEDIEGAGRISTKFTLTVTDNYGQTDEASVDIYINREPTAVIKISKIAGKPVPIIGEPVVNEGETLELDGSASSDPDGDIRWEYSSWGWSPPGYNWKLERYVNSDKRYPIFTAPIGIKDIGRIDTIFELTVVGNYGASWDTDSASTPRPVRINRPPKAVAKADKTEVVEGEEIVLIGDDSYDLDSPQDTPASDIKSYSWAQVGAGPRITSLQIDSQNPKRARFTAPNVSGTTAESVTLRLTVEDSNGLPNINDVMVNINPSPKTLYVDKNSTHAIEDGSSAHPYKTIAGAIERAKMDSSIETIEVKIGTYNENVELIEGVTLRSSDWYSETQRGGMILPTTSVISGAVTMADSSNLYGFNIEGSVSIDSVSDVEVAYNTISGIAINFTDAGNVEDIYIHNNILAGLSITQTQGNPSKLDYSQIEIINNTVEGEISIDANNNDGIVINSNIITVTSDYCIYSKRASLSVKFNYLYNSDSKGKTHNEQYVTAKESDGNIIVKGPAPYPLYDDGYHISEDSVCVDNADQSLGCEFEPGGVRDMGAYGNTSEGTQKTANYNKIPIVDTVSVEFESSPPKENERITFRGSGHDEDGSITTYEWTVKCVRGTDMEEILKADKGEYIYDAGLALGDYTLSLRVRDNQGKWSMPLAISYPFGIGYPSDLNAQSGTDSITLTWQDNSITEDGFQVERLKSGDNPNDPKNWNIVEDNLRHDGMGEMEFIDKTPEPGVTYWYQIGAVKKGLVYYSDRDYEKVPGSKTTTSVGVLGAKAKTSWPPNPYAPEELTANVVSCAFGIMVDLSWLQDMEFPVSGYKIYRSVKDPASFSLLATNVYTMSYSDKDNIRIGDTYYYKVVAYNDRFGDSSPSFMAEAKIPGNVPPTVNIISPKKNSYLWGKVDIDIEAFDFESDRLDIRLYYKKGEEDWISIDPLIIGQIHENPSPRYRSLFRVPWDTSTLTPGEDYSLRAIAYDGNNESSECIVTPLIIVKDALPKAAFTTLPDPPEGYPPLEVKFEDKSSGFPTSWRWDFGDYQTGYRGYQTGYGKVATHTYKLPGTYKVKLTVTNPVGRDTKELPIKVLYPPPVADFTTEFDPLTMKAPLKVGFKDKSTGFPTEWRWDFGDSHCNPTDNISSQPNPTHIYTEPGEYTVTLTVTNPRRFDGSSTKTVNIQVLYPPPLAKFSADKDTGDAPLEVIFTDKSEGQITSWQWRFKEGMAPFSYSLPTRHEALSYQYDEPGTYTVTLKVEGPAGSDTEELKINVLCPKPHADFVILSPIPPEGEPPLTVKFEDKSIGSPTSWRWDFGDAGTSTEQNPTHRYEKPGTYTVKLKVENSRGYDETEKIDCVNVLCPPIDANFTTSPDPPEGEAPLTVEFIDTSSGYPTEWLWDFGDGKTSREQNPIHVYNQPKKYTVSLIVGNPRWVSQTGDIIIVTPIANFGPLIPRRGEPPFKVDFKDSSLGNIASWLWDFGDGTTSTLQNPTHVYEEVGTYTVSLVVTNSKGISHKETKEDIITVIAVEDSTPPSVFITSPEDYTGDPDGEVEVEGIVIAPGEDLQTVEVQVDSSEWIEAEVIKEYNKYTFYCEVTIPQPPEVYNDILDIYKDYWDVKFSVITAKATDTSGNSSTHSINVIRGFVRLIWLPYYYSASGYKGLTSIAVAKDLLDLMRPGGSGGYHYWTDIGFPSDEEIHRYGLQYNSLIDTTIDLWSNELDPEGMKAALNEFQNILTFDVAQYDDFDEFIKKIVTWLNYAASASDETLYIPVAIPHRDIDGSISWMLATGFAVSHDPAISDFTVYGLFFTDIDGGVGINVYVPQRELHNYIRPFQRLSRGINRYGKPYEDFYETGYGKISIAPIDVDDSNDTYNGKYIAIK